MNIYAAALHIEKREAGPYSRTTQSMLRAFVVHADSYEAAQDEVYNVLKEKYPTWYLINIAVEQTALYGVSVEGAAWAGEVQG